MIGQSSQKNNMTFTTSPPLKPNPKAHNAPQRPLPVEETPSCRPPRPHERDARALLLVAPRELE